MPIYIIRFTCDAYAEIAIRADSKEEAESIALDKDDSCFEIYSTENSVWDLEDTKEIKDVN